MTADAVEKPRTMRSNASNREFTGYPRFESGTMIALPRTSVWHRPFDAEEMYPSDEYSVQHKKNHEGYKSPGWISLSTSPSRNMKIA